jgi:hypothetical protein
MFRYAPPIDIENDGHPDDVIIWDERSRDGSPCGMKFEAVARAAKYALIMKSEHGSTELNRDRTKAVFGHPAGGIWVNSGTPQAYFHSYFRLLGSSYEVFSFRDKYYFDTFFDSSYIADFKDQRFNDPNLANTLGVFLHINAHTQQVCEYYLNESITESHP